MFLALSWFVDHQRIHTKKAAEWIIEQFNFSERSEVRRSRRKAMRVLTGPWFVMATDKVIVFFPARRGGVGPLPNSTGWAWCEGINEAVAVKATNVEVNSVFGVADGYTVSIPWLDHNDFCPGP